MGSDASVSAAYVHYGETGGATTQRNEPPGQSPPAAGMDASRSAFEIARETFSLIDKEEAVAVRE